VNKIIYSAHLGLGLQCAVSARGRIRDT